MKKLFFMVLVLVFTSPAMADWQVTVSGWTMSPGPDLAYEQVLQDDIVVNVTNGFPSNCDNIIATDPKSCVWTIPTKTGQQVKVRSYDIGGAYVDHIVGNVGTGPNPASGGYITVIWP